MNERQTSLPSIGSRVIDKLQSLIDGVTSALNIVGTLLIVAIMLLVTCDVIGRSFFDNPVSGVPEIVSMSIVAIVFLQVAQAFRKGRLTRTDALIGFLKQKLPAAAVGLELIFSLAALWLIWQLFSASVPLFEKAWVRNTFEGTIGDFIAPIWPVKLVILIGCGALMAQLFLHTMALGLQLFGQQTDIGMDK